VSRANDLRDLRTKARPRGLDCPWCDRAHDRADLPVRISTQTAFHMPAYQSVLVVDDDPDIRLVLDELLRREALTPFLAANGVEALEALPRLPRPALILLDMMLPELDGERFLEVLERMPDRGDFSVLVMSASSFTGALNSRPGVLEVLKKPFGVETLLACIRGGSNDKP